MIGTVPSNVYNMLTGYKGAKLPAGFVGYQIAGAGKWQIQKMDQKNGKFVIPENVKLAKTIVVGEGAPMKVKDVLHRSRCIVEGCGKQVMSGGFCSEHYYQARRHPEQFPNSNRALGVEGDSANRRYKVDKKHRKAQRTRRGLPGEDSIH